MPAMPLRLGIAGCGRIASSIHLPILAGIGEAKVIALAEPDSARRQEAALRIPQAACVGEFADLLSVPELDAVVVTLPTDMHAKAAIAAFQRGLHVYLEKPVASSLAEGRDVLSAWRTAGTVGMIGYNYRFLPAYQRARDIVQSGRIGPLVVLRSIFCSSRRALPSWKQRRETGGGALLDLASHHLDLAAWFAASAPLSLTCDLVSRETEDDTALLQVEFAGGVSAQLLATFGGPERHHFEIIGENGALSVDPYGSDVVEIRNAGLDRIRFNRFLDGSKALLSPRYWLSKATGSLSHVSYLNALRSFVQGASVGRQPQPDIQAGCVTLAWLDAARESARDKRKVSLENVSP